MNKSELTRALAKRAGLTQDQARRAIDALFGPDGIIAGALADRARVQILGFGTFEPKRRKGRTGRNPQTGATIHIPSMTVPVFRPSKGLKDAIGDDRVLMGGHHGDHDTDPPD